MSEKTVKDLRQAKAELETSVLRLICEFEIDYGVQVSRVSLDTLFSMGVKRLVVKLN